MTPQSTQQGTRADVHNGRSFPLRTGVALISLAFCWAATVHAQDPVPIPLVNVGGGPMEARFARLDFAQLYLEEQARDAKKQAEAQAQNRRLVESGTVSALDLAAPGKAIREFNQAATLLKQQKSREAIRHLQQAIAAYPKFVSAHDSLGLAYMDLDDAGQARSEFETALKLDDKFPKSFLHLGRLALAQKDFSGAEVLLAKAAALRPRDANILTVLAYAQLGAQQYRQAIDTAGRVHALEHKGLANVHYVAASAAVELKDYSAAQRELEFFVHEDPANPLAPNARSNLEVLARNRAEPSPAATPADRQPQNPANAQRLRDELRALAVAPNGADACAACSTASEETAPTPGATDVPARTDGWTVRKTVDEVAVFFSVTSGGRIVSDLRQSDIQIRDNNRPPEKVLQFTPQALLPLRLGLLVDTSGSVQPRFSFEKRAATNFLREMLSDPADLGFVGGFANATTVTQDFTADRAALAAGVSQLTNAGGTALFDAVSLACWKLAAYPERERAARVLVVVSDGDDNSSHTSLKQAIQDAETTGVTIYTISTTEGGGLKTDADKILIALAERSGGEALFPGDMIALGQSFRKLRELIRSRYLIAYKPAAFQPDGSYHTISIVAQKDGKRLQVHARKGYHARLSAKDQQLSEKP